MDNIKFPIIAYHGVRANAVYDILCDGFLDPKAEHLGECPYDVIWWSVKKEGWGGKIKFSYEIDERTYKEKGFAFVNNSELVCTEAIELKDKRLRIFSINGVVIDNLFKLHDDGTINGISKVIEVCQRLLDGQDTEIFVNKLLRQYGFNNLREYWGCSEDDVMYESKENDYLIEVEADDISLKSFEVRDELNPKFWINNKINSRVRLKLLDLADEFFDNLSVKWVKPKDIILTGSIANYNWSRYSDVDVHILVDFKEVWDKTEFVRDYFDSKKELWLQEHDGLKIYGFPVEIYVEDSNEENPSSGIYSLNKNKWLVEPNDFQDANLNEEYVKKESARLMTMIDDVEKQLQKEKDNHKLETLSGKVKKIFDRLHKQRQESLDKHGEYGTYNIIWKVLRRSGHLEKIWDIINTIYNKVNSIK